MSRNKLIAIGIFIFGAILLSAGALLLFASRDIFQEKRYFVAYFEKSVAGLDVGAPIKFRGIEMGKVKSIEGVFEEETATVYPRIILEVYPETLRNAKLKKSEYSLFKPLVDRGMRASLKSQSMLTGQLYVSLDFHPDKPVRRLAVENDEYPEMPTIDDTGLAAVLDQIEGLPVEELIDQITNTLDSVEALLENEGVRASLDSLPELIESANLSVQDVGKLFASDLPKTTQTIRELIADENGSLKTLSHKLENETLVTLENSVSEISTRLSSETLGNISSFFDQAETSIVELETTLSLLQERLEPSDPISYELKLALQEIHQTARSFKSLADFLKDNPESLIQGKD